MKVDIVNFNTKDELKIVVIGVGNAGNSIVEHLLDSDIADKVKLVSVDADDNDLEASKISNKLKLNIKHPKGLDGYGPSLYRQAAIDASDEIKEMLSAYLKN